MSLHPEPIALIPEETARVARAAFPRGNVYMQMRDELGAIYDDQQLAALFTPRECPAGAPWRLALVAGLSNEDDQEHSKSSRCSPWTEVTFRSD